MAKHADRHRPIAFIGVGSVAALVHWLVVLVFVDSRTLAPLPANVAGWSVAFVVSFVGHHRFTFGAQRAPLVRAAVRFFALSASGFALNQLAFAGLLYWAGWRYELALAAVLLTVAVATYLAGRHWAFLGTAAHRRH